jgi:hypothetical protein
LEQQYLGLLEIISLIGVVDLNDIKGVVEISGLNTPGVETLLRLAEEAPDASLQEPTHYASFHAIRTTAVSMLANGDISEILKLIGPNPPDDLFARLGLANAEGPLQKHYQGTCADQVAFYAMEVLTVIFKQPNELILVRKGDDEDWENTAILGFMRKLNHEG